MSNVLDFGVNGFNPSKVGGTGTAIKYFPRPLPGYGNQGQGGPGNAFPSTPSTSSAVGALFLPAQNVYNGQEFNIVAVGSVGSDTGDPSGTVNIQLQAVTGTLSAPVYTTIAQTSALAPTFPAAESWMLDVVLFGDSDSGRLQGFYEAMLANVLVNSAVPKAIDAQISGLDFNLGNPSLQQGAVLGFVVGVTFGTSDATNKAKLYEFTIES